MYACPFAKSFKRGCDVAFQGYGCHNPKSVPSFRRQHVSVKSGIRNRIESIQNVVSSHCPDGESALPRDRIPTHGGRSEGDPTAHAAALSRVLGLPQSRLMAMVARCPALFSFSPEALDATVLAIAGLTGLQTYQVPQLLVVEPELLLQPDRLKKNIRGISQALGVPISEVGSMAAREPGVLALSGREVEVRIGALLDMLMLAGRYGDLVAAALQNPGVLLVPEPETVLAQLRALESALEPLTVGDCGGPTGPDGLVGPGAQSEEAQSSLMHSEQAKLTARAPAPVASLRALVAPLVLAKPSLLATPPELLAGRVAHLADKAGVAPSRVLVAAAAGPNLLAASSCHVDRHCTALATSLPTAVASAGEAASLLVAAPGLLSQNVGALAAKWHMLTSLLGSHDRWAAWLAAAPPAERAEMLALPYTTVARLRFLADRGMQPEAHPLQVVRETDPAFHIRFPGFREWLRS